jgi:hypothetical protein
MTTVRLPIDYEQKLTALATVKKKSKTEIIKEALEILFHQEESTEDSYESGKNYFGKYGSGNGTLSVTYKSKLKEKINAKCHSH